MSNWLESAFSRAYTAVRDFFGSHGAAIQSAISDAQEGVSAATLIASAAGETGAVSLLGEVSNGLSAASGAVAAEESATTFAAQADALSSVVKPLAAASGVKDAATLAGIGKVATKVTGVIGTLQVAAQTATTV